MKEFFRTASKVVLIFAALVAGVICSYILPEKFPEKFGWLKTSLQAPQQHSLAPVVPDGVSFLGVLELPDKNGHPQQAVVVVSKEDMRLQAITKSEIGFDFLSNEEKLAWSVLSKWQPTTPILGAAATKPVFKNAKTGELREFGVGEALPGQDWERLEP